MLVSSDASPSYVLDAQGRTVAQSAWGEEGVVRARVSRVQDRTVYSWLGPRVLLLPLALCMWALLYRMGVPQVPWASDRRTERQP
jgi:apolipoprotein N-acyltransferase